MTKQFRALSGMRPTGSLHFGNFHGAIKQFLELQAMGADCFFFVADLHAYTRSVGLIEAHRMAIEVARLYIACGVDPQFCTLYRQSDIPEISEVAILLDNVVSVGRLSRCVTFKDELRKTGNTESESSLGLLRYPVLMSADILCVRADCVPVGKDQTQHVEIARYIAGAFNRMFEREVLLIPEMHLQSPVTIPGLDGSEKMGKSDGNTLGLLETENSIRKKIGRIPTQTDLGGVMEPGTRALFTLADLCCPTEIAANYRERFANGDGTLFGDMKKRLGGDIVDFLKPIQHRYEQLSDDDIQVKLRMGAVRVREIASNVLSQMQEAMGIRQSAVVPLNSPTSPRASKWNS